MTGRWGKRIADQAEKGYSRPPWTQWTTKRGFDSAHDCQADWKRRIEEQTEVTGMNEQPGKWNGVRDCAV